MVQSGPWTRAQGDGLALGKADADTASSPAAILPHTQLILQLSAA